MDEDELAELGTRVKKARTDRGWGKERAAREAAKTGGTFSAITWKRIEDGEVVQDAKLGAALHVLGLDVNGLPVDDRPTHGLDPVTAAAIRQAVADEVEKHLRAEPSGEA